MDGDTFSDVPGVAGLYLGVIDDLGSFEVVADTARPLASFVRDRPAAVAELALIRNGSDVWMPPAGHGRLGLAIKRGLDLVASAAGLLALSPLLLALAVAIRLTSPGPVLFRQLRIGLRGQRFTVLKFRTMHLEGCDAGGVAQAKPGDERVTPIGRLMRRCSLDELPQLFNVLWGSMSLVGPRPYVEGMLAGGRHYHEIAHYYRLREAVKPGMTGWAQANGLRGPTDDRALALKRLDHDIAYIQHWSLLLDLRILWMTVRNEFLSGSGI